MSIRRAPRYASAIVALVLTASTLQIAQAANFSGKWAFSGQIMGPTVAITTSPVCVLRQSGNRLTGSCRGPNAIGAAAGSVSGPVMILQWKTIPTTSRGVRTVITMRGRLGSDGIVRGTLNAAGMIRTGTFSGQRV